MTESRKAKATQQRILDAAMDLVQSQGGGQFSLDAVAKHAGISKGGLLYNFPSKEALIRAMVQQHIDSVRAVTSAAEAELANDPYRHKLMRAFIQGFYAKIHEHRKPSGGLLAAVVEDPSLLDPLRDYQNEIYARIEAESEDPELAKLAFFATEGIRSDHIFQIMRLSPVIVKKHLTQLIEMLK